MWAVLPQCFDLPGDSICDLFIPDRWRSLNLCSMMFHVRVGNGILFVLGLETNWIVMDCQGQTIYSWTYWLNFPKWLVRFQT